MDTADKPSAYTCNDFSLTEGLCCFDSKEAMFLKEICHISDSFLAETIAV